MDSLFVDYTLNDTVFFRAGTFGMGWGRARLFDSPADLVSRIDDGAAFRASVPTGPGSITAVVYSLNTAADDWVDRHGAGNWRSFAAAGQWEATFGGVSTELAAHWHVDEPLGTAAAMTVGLGAVTLAGEVGYRLDRDEPGVPGDGENDVAAVGNFFWETASRSWSYWGEYGYDSAASSGGRHRVGLALRGPSLAPGGWRPGLRWEHAVGDASGRVVLGSSGSVAPGLEATVGVPLFYGDPGSTYRTAEDTSVDPGNDSFEISGENVVAVGLGLSVRFSY